MIDYSKRERKLREAFEAFIKWEKERYENATHPWDLYIYSSDEILDGLPGQNLIDLIYPNRDYEDNHACKKAYFYGFMDAIDCAHNEIDRRHVLSYLDNELYEWTYKDDGGTWHIRPGFEKWKDIRKRILERDKKKCFYCGKNATHVDHLVPVSRGGSYQDENLVASCKKCNLEKSTMTAYEYLGLGGEGAYGSERTNQKTELIRQATFMIEDKRMKTFFVRHQPKRLKTLKKFAERWAL